MKVSYNWLREVAGITATVDELVHRMANVGLKLEGIEPYVDDWTLDFEVTVNRPDCLSVYGLAREAAAAFGVAVPALPKIQASEPITVKGDSGSYPTNAAKPLSVFLDAPDLCPRYTGMVLTGAKVGPSPEWLRKRLEASGHRSINNVVDVTNFVMLELGQPLHAFDYDKIAKSTIRVRLAKNESLTLLDGKERALKNDMLVIADADRATALAGVMGGLDSEVTHSTTTLLLEAAYFDPKSVRKTARALDMNTDASYRFERGVDPTRQSLAARRAAYLLEEVAGAKASPVLDVCDREFPQSTILMRSERIERVLGEKIDPKFVDTTLTALGFVRDGNGWKVPLYRVDMKREVDLIEEIARHYGYNKFADTLPEAEKKYQPDYPTYEMERALSACLRAAGIDEAYTFSLVGSSPYSVAGEQRVQLLNPISEATADMRTSILPGLLEGIEHNLRHRGTNIRLFEIGRVFLQSSEKITLAIAMMGDFRELKGVLETALPALEYERPIFNGQSIFLSGNKIGTIGISQVLEQPVAVCEVYLSDLIEIPKKVRLYQPIIPYPFVERDVTFLVDASLPYSSMESVLNGLKMTELRSYLMTDRYSGKNTPDGKVAVTFRLTFQSDSRTLLSEEVDTLFARIVDQFAKELDATLRG